MNNVFIVLEGLSGSGKTAVGQIIAKIIGGEFYKTPSLLFDSIRDKIDRQADKSARFLFYLAGVIQSADEISHILTRKSVICDRYLLTTLCYHRAFGIPIDIPDLVFEPLLKPDYTFLIICKDEIRIERLRRRGLSYNDLQERQPDIEQRFLAEYRKHNLIEIDNSNDNPKATAEKIISFLGE